MLAWDDLVQPTGKYCSIRHMKYPEFQTGIFGRMESAPCNLSTIKGIPQIEIAEQNIVFS